MMKRQPKGQGRLFLALLDDLVDPLHVVLEDALLIQVVVCYTPESSRLFGTLMQGVLVLLNCLACRIYSIQHLSARLYPTKTTAFTLLDDRVCAPNGHQQMCSVQVDALLVSQPVLHFEHHQSAPKR